MGWPRLPNFKGRDQTLTDLHTTLKGGTGRAGIITVAGLHGQGGVGKTQLAVEYAHQYMVEYQGGVYWINAVEDWKRQIVDFARRLGLTPADSADPNYDDRMVMAFRDHLVKQDEDELLVIDNVHDPKTVKQHPLAAGMTLGQLCQETDARQIVAHRIGKHHDSQLVLINYATGPGYRFQTVDLSLRSRERVHG